MAERRAPRATYRLQFHRGFTFRDALGIVDYLAELGISHVYASPILRARPGSTHGYDIVDHGSLNPEIGSAEELSELAAALRRRDIGIILDIVPNHMAVGGRDNAWWLDVLEWGEDSPYARFFDIDWSPRSAQRGKVLLPVLGDQFGRILAKGEIALAFAADEGSFSAWYYDHRWPIDPRDYPEILGPDDRALAGEFAALQDLRPRAAYERAAVLKRELACAATSPASARRFEQLAAGFAGTAGDLASWEKLRRLLDRQSYRPAYWRVAADEINYRRFFNINDLAGLRVEEPEVFEAVHRLVLRLVADGIVEGLRIDHIDGLYDPRRYCERLQERIAALAPHPDTRAEGPCRPFYVIVEKILASHERLPTEWPVAGTTGYDSLNLVNGLFVDPKGEARLDRFYRRFAGRSAGFDEVLYASKKRIMQVNLASEMGVLAGALHRLSSRSLMTRDFTLRGIREALEEVFAFFPVYRTYVAAESGAAALDRRHIDWAVSRARKASAAADTSVFDFLEAVLTGDLAKEPGYPPEDILAVAMRAQQLTGPVMAKGAEDTAFYRYHRLLSLNEVGGDPRRFGLGIAAFHRANAERLERAPLDLLAGTTHDTKRGEDARARIDLLSELPAEWARRVAAWTRLNRSRRTSSGNGGAPMPYANDEYLFYQALLGAWPADLSAEDAAGMHDLAERLDAFMRKAAREGKEQSSWGNPNAAYEEALSRFVMGSLETSPTNPFPSDFASFAERIARRSRVNSLAQTLLRLTMPGIPDIYRGSELWELSLVDPDNRRPVDFAARTALLREVMERAQGEGCRAALLRELAERWTEGGEKLFLIAGVLAERRRRPDLFTGGSYSPILASGTRADHIVAFRRERAGEAAIIVAPRLTGSIPEGEDADVWWGDTRLPIIEGGWRDVLSGAMWQSSGELPAATLLARFPVALLGSP